MRLQNGDDPIPSHDVDAARRRAPGRSVVQQGVRAGTWAAGGVACGLALVDARAGEPLMTPALLGYGVAHALGLPALADSPAGVVAGSTALHLGSCIAVATVAAAIARRARGAAVRGMASLLLLVVAGLALVAVGAVLARTNPMVADAVARFTTGEVLGWILVSAAILAPRPHGPDGARRPARERARSDPPKRALATVAGATAAVVLVAAAAAAGAQTPDATPTPDSATAGHLGAVRAPNGDAPSV